MARRLKRSHVYYFVSVSLDSDHKHTDDCWECYQTTQRVSRMQLVNGEIEMLESVEPCERKRLICGIDSWRSEKLVVFADTRKAAIQLAREHFEQRMEPGWSFSGVSVYRSNYIRESRGLICEGKFAGEIPDFLLEEVTS